MPVCLRVQVYSLYSLLLCMIGCGNILTPVPLALRLGAFGICTEEFNSALRRMPQWAY